MLLYRALRPEEIARGGVLIPKSRPPFVAQPMLPLVLSFTLGERAEHAVRAHQWNGQYPTSGVSTTPHISRANYYAQRHRMIASIAVKRLAEFGVQMFRVSDHVHDSCICTPEDDEVILVCPGVEYFPKEIIEDVFELANAIT